MGLPWRRRGERPAPTDALLTVGGYACQDYRRADGGGVQRYRCLPELAWPAGCVEAHYLH